MDLSYFGLTTKRCFSVFTKNEVVAIQRKYCFSVEENVVFSKLPHRHTTLFECCLDILDYIRVL